MPQGWAKLVALLDFQPGADPIAYAQRLCELCVESTQTSGAALAIASAEHRSTVYATDALGEALEELQTTFSEGPSVDALRGGYSVQVPDLAEVLQNRWPLFAPAALGAGAGAVYAFPAGIGGIRLGVVSLYRTGVGALSAGNAKDMLVLADVAAVLLTVRGAAHMSEAFAWTVGDQSRFRPEVHQAVGVLMVELGVDAGDAFARLAAHAFATDHPMAEVAAEIVTGRLRLDRG